MSKNFFKNAALSLAVFGFGLSFSTASAIDVLESHCDHHCSNSHQHEITELLFNLQFELLAVTGTPRFTPYVVLPDGSIVEGASQEFSVTGPISFPIQIADPLPGAYVVGVRGDVSGSVLDSFTASAGILAVTSNKSTTVGIVSTGDENFVLPLFGAATGEVNVIYVYSLTLHP